MQFDISTAIIRTGDGTTTVEDPGVDFEARVLVVPDDGDDDSSRLIPFEQVIEMRGERADTRLSPDRPEAGDRPGRV